jgi:hypothetical protein
MEKIMEIGIYIESGYKHNADRDQHYKMFLFAQEKVIWRKNTQYWRRYKKKIKIMDPWLTRPPICDMY